MAKYDAKTKAGTISVKEFLDDIEDEQVRADCHALTKLMKKVSGHEPVLWGSSIVGFGSYHYKYDSGHEGDSCITGFAPRKGNIAVYTHVRLEDEPELMKKLGKVKHGKACINIKKLSDVDAKVLETIIEKGIKNIRKKYASL